MEIGGWQYDYTSLRIGIDMSPIHGIWKKWHGHEKSDTACLIYAIGEVRMGMEMGYLAVLHTKSQPQLLLNLTSLLFPIQEPFLQSRWALLSF